MKYLPTYKTFLFERLSAKTDGDIYEINVTRALAELITKKGLIGTKHTTMPSNAKLIKSTKVDYEGCLNDAEKVLNEIERIEGKKVKFIKCENTGRQGTKRPLIIKNGKIDKSTIAGKHRIADILLITNTNHKYYISVKYGTHFSLSSTSLRNYSDKEISELYDFLGINRELVEVGMDAYSSQIYSLILKWNEIIPNPKIKIKPPERIYDQEYLIGWLTQTINDNWKNSTVFVSKYDNFFLRKGDKFFGV